MKTEGQVTVCHLHSYSRTQTFLYHTMISYILRAIQYSAMNRTRHGSRDWRFTLLCTHQSRALLLAGPVPYVLTGGRVIKKAFYLEHVSAFVMTSSSASSPPSYHPAATDPNRNDLWTHQLFYCVCGSSADSHSVENRVRGHSLTLALQTPIVLVGDHVCDPH